MIEYAFQYVGNNIFYVEKNNIRSQKAVEKIGSKRLADPSLKHLIKESKLDWTYLIRKKDWKKEM